MSLLRKLLLITDGRGYKEAPKVWLSGFGYRKSHDIDGSTAGAQTDYQMRVIIHRKTGVDSGEDVYVGSKCREDFGDVRFTKSDGITELDYWLEGINDKWIDKTDLPAGRGDVTACVIGGKLYVFGGYSGTVVYKSVYEYDPATDSWAAKDDMPTARWGAIAVACNGKAYVFGGSKVQPEAVGQYTNVLEIFDPSQPSGSQWTSGTSMSWSAQGLMGVYFPFDGLIHLFGGKTAPTTWVATHESYDPVGDSYDATPADMPAPRNWGTCAVVGNNIYVIGGATTGTVITDTCWRYNPSPSNNWTTLTAMPATLLGATRENPVINGKIYVTHGWGAAYRTTVFEYDVAGDSWATKTSGINARDGLACGVIDDILYVVGGRADTVGLAYHEAYEPYIGVFWVEVDSIPVSPDSVSIYVYYGKADATTTSNIFNTMNIGDDFDDGSIHAQWIQDKGHATRVTLSEHDGYLDVDKTYLHYYVHIEKAGLPDGLMAVAKVRWQTANEGTWAGALALWFNGLDWVDIKRISNLYIYSEECVNGTVSNVAQSSETHPNNEWRWIKIIVTSTTIYFYYSIDGLAWTSLGSCARNAGWTIDGNSLLIVGCGYEATGYTNPDWDNNYATPASGTVEYHYNYVFVKKYVDPEPSHGVWGSEETP